MSAHPRTRLSPEARTRQLLATAKQMIAEDGLQNFTMEALARTAEVTSPLVYNYFSSRQDLLRALLREEYDKYAAKLTQEVTQAGSFEEVVHVFINSNFDHFAPGNIMPILDSQPEIADIIKSSRKKHGNNVAQFLVSNTSQSYAMTKKVAEQVISMSSGASIAAAEYASRAKIPRKKAVTIAFDYIMAGLNAIAKSDH